MKYEGAITEIDLIEKLLELTREQFTGAIRFENDAIIKIIYFKSGDVLSASTNDRGDSIDEILLRSNKVSREHIKQALAKRKESETLGDALLALGFITRKELTWARRVQLIGMLRSLIRWSEGTYTIVNDYLPKREEGTLFHLPQLVVELIVTDDDRTRVETALSGGRAVPSLAPDAAASYAALGLNEDADTIFATVDGRKSVAEIAASSTMDAFSVYKLLFAFKTLGLIDERKPQESHEVSVLATQADDWSLDDYEEEELPSFPPPASETSEIGAMASTTELLPTIDLDDSLPTFDEPVATQEPEMFADTVAPEPVAPVRPPRATMPMTPIPGALSTPRSRPAPTFATSAPRKRGRGPLLMLLGLIVLAAAGFFGYRFWSERKADQAAATEAPRPNPPAPQPSEATGTIVDVPVATATETVTATETASITTAPAAMPPNTTTVVAAQPVPVAPVAPPVAAPVPAPVAADGERARFEALARENLSEIATSPYAVQIAAVCETSSLQNSIRSGGASVWFVPARIGGRSCFRVFWGRYPNREAAGRGLAEIPQVFRKGRPVVVKVADVARQ
jgi:hypothetical protein